MLIRSLAAGQRCKRVAQWWGNFAHDNSAGATLMMAFAMPVIVGALGIGIDVSSWHIQKRKLQQMADSAALGGARVKAADQTDAVVVTVATNDAGRNGYAAATHTLAVNSPPSSGPHVENNGAVEAIVTTELKSVFSVFTIGSEMRTLRARSVAAVMVVADPDIRKSVCMLSLATSGMKTIFMNGSGSVVARDCTMAAHSTNAKAVYLNGSGTIKAFTALLAGGYHANGSGSFVFTAPAATYQTNVPADPHADLEITGMPSTCTKSYFESSGGEEILPGRYCGGIRNSGSGTLVLKPGTYYIDAGNVENSGSGSIVCGGCDDGRGVTLVFTASSHTQIGGLFSNGSGRVVLSAPAAGPDVPYPGVVIFQDRSAKASIEEWGAYLNGSGGDQLSGAVYIPSRGVHLNGSGAVGENGKACISIVALTIEMIGSGTIQTTDCDTMSTVVARPKTVALMLVE